MSGPLKWNGPKGRPHYLSERQGQNGAADNAKDKAEVERFRKAISEKLKDPNLAKKAALLIEELLKNSPLSKKKTGT